MGVKEEGVNHNAIEGRFVQLVHMHTSLQSPSAHTISCELVTPTKTKTSWFLSVNDDVGGPITNASQRQLELHKCHTGNRAES